MKTKERSPSNLLHPPQIYSIYACVCIYKNIYIYLIQDETNESKTVLIFTAYVAKLIKKQKTAEGLVQCQSHRGDEASGKNQKHEISKCLYCNTCCVVSL